LDSITAAFNLFMAVSISLVAMPVSVNMPNFPILNPHDGISWDVVTGSIFRLPILKGVLLKYFICILPKFVFWCTILVMYAGILYFLDSIPTPL